jgi:hypothetical protein
MSGGPLLILTETNRDWTFLVTVSSYLASPHKTVGGDIGSSTVESRRNDQ